MTAVPSSRIAVFASSTIGECAPERAAQDLAGHREAAEELLARSYGLPRHVNIVSKKIRTLSAAPDAVRSCSFCAAQLATM
jgi:hypothetical protein